MTTATAPIGESEPDMPPNYFESIREKARQRWQQLEDDPELAGPWHQLFRQVQSSRHVVSELLQNADDAGATAASVQICDGDFVFSHNGEDFTDDHFASLCRFGYSNKRTLHTIGFRGIGFKSTFSLGDKVQLLTPSLAVAFFRERFTEPVWIEGGHADRTEVRVTIKDKIRERELKKNLDEWLISPASLLFFNSIRRLTIGEQEVRWVSEGRGPICQSEWVKLSREPGRRYLIIRSDEQAFPEDAVREIRQERMVPNDEDSAFPPCRVELVLGLEGRLFVILPTGVRTELPFACNAPLMQDPARVKVKDPDISPTNYWLLSRIGTVAASAMLEWLRREDLTPEERSKAYALFTDVNRDDSSIEGSCGRIAQEAFEAAVENEPFLLTEDGNLVGRHQCIAVPHSLLDVWSSEQVPAWFDADRRPTLSREIDYEHQEKLSHWQVVDELEHSRILDVLESRYLPRPESWRQLLTLWNFISDDICSRRFYHAKRTGVRIVPVQGKDVLYSAEEVVRLGEKRLLQSEDDWEFLSRYLLVANQNWSRYLAEQRRKAEQQEDDALGDHVESAYDVLKSLGLDDASDVSRVIGQVADVIFRDDEYPLEDCIRFAQIAAKLGATVSGNFRFVTRDDLRTPVEENIIVDFQGDLDLFVDEDWYTAHLLHEEYARNFVSCSRFEWEQWIESGRSGLLTFVPLESQSRKLWRRDALRDFLQDRGFVGEPIYQYVTHQFVLNDWDFADSHWEHWYSLAEDDEEFWARLFERILRQPQSYWLKATSAKASQIATTGNTKSVTREDLLPSWIARFRGLPCLWDTRGCCREPAELLRRTPDTESLLDVEPFVRAEDDTEHTRQILLKLGVRDTPTGPDRLLDRLRALAKVDSPPVYEVEKWYNRLDQLFGKCSTDDAREVREAFSNEKLVLSDRGSWTRASEVFIDADEDDVPDAAIVHPSVRDLAMWHRIGVADRPTIDLAIEWLQGLPAGEKLSADELRRVRSLLPRYSSRIWDECKHWLNLEGEWVAVDGLDYKLTMQSLIPWRNLFQPIKKKTADLQRLSAETCEQHPFSELSSLAGRIEERLQENLHGLSDPEHHRWIESLGIGLSRVEFDDETEQARIRKLGKRLANTFWQVATSLESVPYIDGAPAGTPRRIRVLWNGTRLYVEDQPIAKLLRPIALELGRAFERSEIGEAIRACVDRSPQFIFDYLEANFTLSPESDLEDIEPTPENDDVSSSQTEKRNNTDEVSGSSVDEDASRPGEYNDPDSPEAHESESHDDEEDLFEGESETDDEPTADDQRRKTRDQRRRKPKPSLIELMAAGAGFTKDGSADRFCNADGDWIQRATGSSFPWEHYTADGNLSQCYWVKDCCIHREPVQLDAAVWTLCERDPSTYSLLLRNGDDGPHLLSGHDLCDLRSRGQLTLYPASYRLEYNHGEM